MSSMVSNEEMFILEYYFNEFHIPYMKYDMFKKYWSVMDISYMKEKYTKGKVKEAREFIFFELVGDYEIHVKGFNNTLIKYLTYDFNKITDKEEKHNILDNFLYDFEEYFNLIVCAIDKLAPLSLTQYSKKVLNTTIASLKPQEYIEGELPTKVKSYEYEVFCDMIYEGALLFREVFKRIKMEITLKKLP